MADDVLVDASLATRLVFATSNFGLGAGVAAPSAFGRVDWLLAAPRKTSLHVDLYTKTFHGFQGFKDQ